MNEILQSTLSRDNRFDGPNVFRVDAKFQARRTINKRKFLKGKNKCYYMLRQGFPTTVPDKTSAPRKNKNYQLFMLKNENRIYVIDWF